MIKSGAVKETLMTSQDYLTSLEQGVEHWNRWRDEHPELNPDLSSAYLFQANLRGANLRQVNLNRACLIGADLTGANLEEADLTGVYASGANFTSTQLRQANLQRANLSEANFTNADLSDAQLQGSNLTATHFTGATLDGCAVDALTLMDGIQCDYIELERQRYPATGVLSAGAIADLLRPAPTTGIPIDGLPERPPTQWPQPTLPPTMPPSEPRSYRTLLAVGLAALVSGALAIGIYAAIRSATTREEPAASQEATLPPVPCNEPAPPPLPKGKARYTYPDGTRFYGKFSKGHPANGRGIMVFKSGNRYDGEYQDGKRNGCGTFTFANKRRYVGEFQDDQFHGIGTWVLENGDRYIGEFNHNKCEGKGTFIFANGSSKTGEWQDGTMVDDTTVSCDRNDDDSTPQLPPD